MEVRWVLEVGTSHVYFHVVDENPVTGYDIVQSTKWCQVHENESE
jgi:hypothetical protein